MGKTSSSGASGSSSKASRQPIASGMPASRAATWARTTPARVQRSAIEAARCPSSAARVTSSSGWLAPVRKVKFEVTCSSA